MSTAFDHEKRASWTQQLCSLLEKEGIVEGEETLSLLHALSRSLTLRAMNTDLRTAFFSLHSPSREETIELTLRVIKGSLFTTTWHVFARFDDEYSLCIDVETNDNSRSRGSDALIHPPIYYTGSRTASPHTHTHTHTDSTNALQSFPSSLPASHPPISPSASLSTSSASSFSSSPLFSFFNDAEREEGRPLLLWRMRGFDPSTFTLSEGELRWQHMRSLARWLGLGDQTELVPFTRLLNQLLLNLPAFVRSKEREKDKLQPPMPLCLMFNYLAVVASAPLAINVKKEDEEMLRSLVPQRVLREERCIWLHGVFPFESFSTDQKLLCHLTHVPAGYTPMVPTLMSETALRVIEILSHPLHTRDIPSSPSLCAMVELVHKQQSLNSLHTHSGRSGWCSVVKRFLVLDARALFALLLFAQTLAQPSLARQNTEAYAEPVPFIDEEDYAIAMERRENLRDEETPTTFVRPNFGHKTTANARCASPTMEEV